MTKEHAHDSDSNQHSQELATLAGGCFWCTEALFNEIKGVSKVVSGYTGGHVDYPTYQQICYEDTGHAEAVQVTYDTEVITYGEILEIFYAIHDPTTLNQQGNDIGPQYRSAIFYHSEEQRQIAEDVTTNFAAQHWENPVVTEIVPLQKFWTAEGYHQNYFASNPEQAYCQMVINPKLAKFRTEFVSKLKTT